MTVQVVDCTLRDGEQAPGVWFTLEEKVQIGKLLDAAGVDVLDAGFPAIGAEEVEALQELRRACKRARIAATARPVAGDIAAAARARAQDVFLFFPVSDQHLSSKLGIERKQVVPLLRSGIEASLEAGLRVFLVAEDAFRSDSSWLASVVEALLDLPLAGFVVCDTVGAATPWSTAQRFADLRTRWGDLPLCTHCHNDFGLATANTLAAVRLGASMVSCTVNGIGERAGNADLAEVVAGIDRLLNMQTGVRPEFLPQLAELVDFYSGIHTSPVKPVTGYNVYSHESGVHVDGVLKDARNYEHLAPEWSGRRSRLIIGKHSGTAHIRKLMQEAGLPSDEGFVRRVLSEARRINAERGKQLHHLAFAQASGFREAALGGIPEERVVALARQLLESEPQVEPLLARGA